MTHGVVEPEDALALADRIRSGRTTACAAIEATLDRAQNCSALGAVRFLDAELARAQADAIDTGLARRARRMEQAPFVGVPFLMKDLGAGAAGLPLTCGSAFLADAPRVTVDSDLAQRFRRAGLNLFGVTTAPEFGLSLASEPQIGPIARNPLDPTRTPGGSSGGAAAAVARGIVAMAHATDAAGSIRVPAACCGLVGLKPTRGATPGGPGFGNYLGGMAAELVVCRSLRDAAVALDVTAGAAEGAMPDPELRDPLVEAPTRTVTPLRIGLCTEDGAGFTVAAERRAAVDHAADVLSRCGHRIVPVGIATLSPLVAQASFVFDRTVSAYLAAAFVNVDTAVSASLEPLTRAVIRRGQALSATDLVAAEKALVLVSHAMWRLFDTIDVLLTPMLTAPPPLLGSFPTDSDDVEAQWQRMHAFAPFAALANVAGTPALTVPHGTDGAGLPLPVQLIGPMASDKLLLRLAGELESARPWRFGFPVAGLGA